MKEIILITGRSGMLASRLIEILGNKYQIRTLSTSESKNSSSETSFYWNPGKGEIESASVKGIKGILHLSGYPITAKWTDKNKKLIRDSRVKAAELLLRACAEEDVRPEFFISASAMGIYGYGRKGKMTEFNLPGDGYVASLCKDWEDASLSFEAIGSRVVNARISLIISGNGGFISKMKPIYKLGLGSALGSGKQPMPWIHIDDLCEFLKFAIDNKEIEGPYNLVSPEEVDLETFGKTMARIMNKPYFMPKVPKFVIQMIFGKRSQLFLDTPEVKSLRLNEIPFRYKYPDLESALKEVLS